jgi:hypothetical protein
VDSKTPSLRLPPVMAAELAAIAKVEDDPLAEAIRKALEEYIVRRRSEPDFKERLAKRLEEDDDLKSVWEQMT